jgi:hypothetical protein
MVASFKFKMTSLVAAMVFFAAIGVGGLSLLIAESEMRHVIASQEMSLLTSASAHIESDLRAKQHVLTMLSEEARTRRLGLRHIQQLLEQHDALKSNFYNVVAFDNKGNLVASLGSTNVKKLNIANRPHFVETLSKQRGIISQPFTSALSGKPQQYLLPPSTFIDRVLQAN